MERTQQLLVRLQLEELNAEFAFRVDHGPTAAVADLFTPDGRYGRADGPFSQGQDAIRATYAARDARGVRTARHVFTNLRLTYEATDRVTGTTILTLFAEDGSPPLPASILSVSDFEDVYVLCEDSRWRYRSRTIRSLFVSDRAPVLPLGIGLTGEHV